MTIDTAEALTRDDPLPQSGIVEVLAITLTIREGKEMQNFLRSIMLLLVTMTLAACSGQSKKDVNGENAKQTINALQKLGAKVSLDTDGNILILEFSKLPVTDAALEQVEGLAHLIILQLDDTKITDAALVHLKGLNRLESLNLAGTQISDAGLEHLKGMSNLIGLNLADTKITDAGLMSLKKLKNLIGLNLVRTEITDAGLVSLKELQNLSELNLNFTRITEAGVNEIKKELPKCQIVWTRNVGTEGKPKLMEDAQPNVVATPQPSPAVASLSVEGKVAYEYDPLVTEDESGYYVTIKIKNTGESTIQCDKIIGGFFPKNGGPLLVTAQDRTVRGGEIIELVPGALKRLELGYTTVGHTNMLLLRAGDAPLQFSVALYLKNQRIAMPFTAELPPFDKLPRGRRSTIGQPLPLSFRNVEPYKYTPKPSK